MEHRFARPKRISLILGTLMLTAAVSTGLVSVSAADKSADAKKQAEAKPTAKALGTQEAATSLHWMRRTRSGLPQP